MFIYFKIKSQIFSPQKKMVLLISNSLTHCYFNYIELSSILVSLNYNTLLYIPQHTFYHYLIYIENNHIFHLKKNKFI